MIFRFRISFPYSHWNVSLMICGECTVDACTGGLFHVEIVSKIRFTRTHTLHHQPLRTILIQSQSISIQFNLSQIIIQKTFSNHLQPQGIIPSFNDSQGLHETESPNCRYLCSDCYTSHTNQLHALDFVCCHGKIHVFLLSSIYMIPVRGSLPPPPPTWYGPKTRVLQHSAWKRGICSVFCMVGCWHGPQTCKFVGFLQPAFRKRVICNVSATTSWSSAAAPLFLCQIII